MAAVTVGCHTNNPYGIPHCLLPYKLSVKACLFVIKSCICCKNTFICMTTDSDGCHVGYLYDNRQ